MRKIFLLPCLLFGLIKLQAQPATTRSAHLSQNGFVQNQGQLRDEHGSAIDQVKFLYVRDDFHLALKSSGFSYELIRETPDVRNFPESGFTDPEDMQDWRDAQGMQESVCRVDITLKGANPHPVIISDQNTGTVFNYYLGKRAVVNVPSFNRITYKDIYPGIDMVFEDHHSEKGNNPEYSFVVHPGADARQIKMKYSGAGNLSLADQHTLSIATPQGFIKETGLRGYYQEDGSSSEVSFGLKKGMLSFDASIDKTKTFVIDPSIVWGTYFGGTSSENYDTEAEIVLDHNNNVFLTGSTGSKKYIATTGAVMQVYGGSRDMFLAKFSLDGTHLLWATYFGGSSQDVAYGIGCDSYNNIVITGYTKSANVMTTPGVFQTTLQGLSDVLIAKFSNSGQLVWSTLMGGSDDNQAENGRSLTMDVNDNIYICGYVTSSTNIGTPGTYQPNYRGNGDAFLVKFNKDGNKIWGTYFSGVGKDRAHALSLDLFGNVYIIGTAQSKRSFVSGGFQTQFGGSTDAFIAKFDTQGHHFWSSYYGGAGGDHGRGVKCDGTGSVYLDGWVGIGQTNPISTPGSYQENPGGQLDGFIVKFKPNGARVWGTYFGGNLIEFFYGMTIDPQANIYVNGNTSSSSAIASPDALQPNLGGGQDAMIAKFDSAGHRIWSTYFGGTGTDDSYDIERDSSGNIYLAIDTRGPLPVSQNAYQTSVRGQDDYAVFEFNFTPPLCFDTNEPNDSFSTPHVITDSITSSGITLTGSILSTTDEDWFSIHLDPLDTAVTITLTGLTQNYDLVIFDSSNTVIGVAANADTASESITLSHDSGTIIIHIAHDSVSFDPYNCYTLHIALDTSANDSSGEKLSETILSPENHLKIYPNPSSGLITVAFEDTQKSNMTLSVFDAIGRLVRSQAMESKNGTNIFSLDLSDLNAGIYLLQLNGGDVRDVVKFTIEKE